MRVVQIVCSEGFGGVERYVATLAAELSRLPDGPEVVVVGGAQDRMTAQLAGTPVAWLPGDSMVQAARSLVRAGRADLVNAHMTEAELVALGVGALRRTPVVSTRHFARSRGSGPVARVVAGLAARRLAGEVAISHYVAEHAGPAPAAGRTVIHSGVAPEADAVAACDRERAVLVAQRLAPEKETRVALEAWARSSAREHGWRLWVAGSGPCDADLRRLAADLGIEVDLLGRREDLPDLYRRAAILLAPTPIEGFGLTVVEAMAHGLPVVAAGAGGHLETLPPGVAWTFPPGDATHAAKLLDALAADPGLRDALGAELQGRQRVHLTLRRQAEQTHALYRQVLGR